MNSRRLGGIKRGIFLVPLAIGSALGGARAAKWSEGKLIYQGRYGDGHIEYHESTFDFIRPFEGLSSRLTYRTDNGDVFTFWDIVDEPNVREATIPELQNIMLERVAFNDLTFDKPEVKPGQTYNDREGATGGLNFSEPVYIKMLNRIRVHLREREKLANSLAEERRPVVEAKYEPSVAGMYIPAEIKRKQALGNLYAESLEDAVSSESNE